jgi:hypothetical protein
MISTIESAAAPAILSPRKMSPKFAFFSALALLLVPVIQAKLDFPTTSVLMKAAAEDKKLTARFPFTNSGTQAVDILSVTTSCACTLATLDKNRVAPGEAGTVTVVYKTGSGDGLQSQTISLITSESAGNSYVLTFTADIPKEVKVAIPLAAPIAPKMLYWTRKPFQPKTVTVDLKALPGAKLTATCGSTVFQVKTLDSTNAREAVIEITPPAEAPETRSELIIAIETADGKTMQYQVALNIIPSRTKKSP